MASFYDRMAATADKQIAKFGRDMILREYSGTTYDPDTGLPSRAVTDTVFKGLNTNFFHTQRDNSLQESGVRTILCRFDTAPTPDAKVIIDQDEMSISSVQIVKPDCLTVLCKLSVHK